MTTTEELLALLGVPDRDVETSTEGILSKREERYPGRCFGRPEFLGPPPPEKVKPVSTVAPPRERVQRNLFADHLRRVYNITVEQYDKLLAAQDGVCGACGKLPKTGLVVDHDHACCSETRSCGACVRGLLCISCNTSLGFYEKRFNKYLARNA